MNSDQPRVTAVVPGEPGIVVAGTIVGCSIIQEQYAVIDLDLRVVESVTTNGSRSSKEGLTGR